MIDKRLSVCLNTYMVKVKTTLNLNLTRYDQRLINAMSALGDKTRYKIFKLILENKELCVSEIADRLNISVPAVSQHFRTFELIGLVDKDRIGQKICYKLKLDDPIVTMLVNNVRQS